jgi:hypothetical protein
MNIQSQINHCINHLNKSGDGIGRVEISDTNQVYVHSLKTPTQYVTIQSIYTDEQLEILNEMEYDEWIAKGEQIAAEVAESIEEQELS